MSTRLSFLSLGKALRRSYRPEPGPSRFGRYDCLNPSSAMKVYPEPLSVSVHIPRPSYVAKDFWGDYVSEEDVDESDLVGFDELEGDARGIELGSEEEEKVRVVAKMAGEVLSEVGRLVKPGVTTSEIDRTVHDMIVARGAYPSPLGYSRFPKSCTTSVNNVIAHGIPDDRPLLPDDIVNVDLTLYFNGYHGDTSKTFMLPEVDEQGRKLVQVTQKALTLGIEQCRPGAQFRSIGHAIETYVKQNGMSVNTQFSGHGIGRNFHQKPWILHFKNHEKDIMQPGDCFTIEPCVVQGIQSRGEIWEDGWTMSTKSGARSAQFEHQVLITETGCDILTARKDEE